MQTDRPTLPWLPYWFGAGITVLTIYVIVFVITGAASGWAAVFAALANTTPLMLLAGATQQVLRTHIIRFDAKRQIVLHASFAPIFALAWYALVTVLLGFQRGFANGDFSPVGFQGPAATWQMFQGLSFYGVVAATCYAVANRHDPTREEVGRDIASPMARYLIRDEEGLRPLEVAQIVTITGAQDYSEVATLNGRHLVRMTLGDFERLLDRSQFVRVHRSTIISLAHLDVAEAAGGGRMIARMADGQTIQVSRSGAACLRKWAA